MGVGVIECLYLKNQNIFLFCKLPTAYLSTDEFGKNTVNIRLKKLNVQYFNVNACRKCMVH